MNSAPYSSPVKIVAEMLPYLKGENIMAAAWFEVLDYYDARRRLEREGYYQESFLAFSEGAKSVIDKFKEDFEQAAAQNRHPLKILRGSLIHMYVYLASIQLFVKGARELAKKTNSVSEKDKIIIRCRDMYGVDILSNDICFRPIEMVLDGYSSEEIIQEIQSIRPQPGDLAFHKTQMSMNSGYIHDLEIALGELHP